METQHILHLWRNSNLEWRIYAFQFVIDEDGERSKADYDDPIAIFYPTEDGMTEDEFIEALHLDGYDEAWFVTSEFTHDYPTLPEPIINWLNKLEPYEPTDYRQDNN